MTAIIRSVEVFAEPLAVALRASEPHAASAFRRVAGVPDHVRGLLGRVDLRHDDAGSAEIQRLLDRHFGGFGHPHDARGLVAGDLQDCRELGRLERAVLAIDEQPVEAQGCQDLGRGRAGKRDHRAEQPVATLQPRAKVVPHRHPPDVVRRSYPIPERPRFPERPISRIDAGRIGKARCWQE